MSAPKPGPQWRGTAGLQRSLLCAARVGVHNNRRPRRWRQVQRQWCWGRRSPAVPRSLTEYVQGARDVSCQGAQRRRGSQERSRRGQQQRQRGRRRETSWRDAEEVDALLLSPLMEEQHWEEWHQQQSAVLGELSEGTRPRGALGVDYGLKKTGLAASTGFAPRPLEVVYEKGRFLLEKILQVAQREGVEDIVVGMPLLFQGLEGKQATTNRRFAEALAAYLHAHTSPGKSFRVLLFDERRTTREARQSLEDSHASRRRQKRQLDAVAAAILLENYFNTRAFETGEAELIDPAAISDNALDSAVEGANDDNPHGDQYAFDMSSRRSRRRGNAHKSDRSSTFKIFIEISDD